MSDLTEFLLSRIAEDESGDDAQLVGSTRKDWSVRWKAECEVKRRIIGRLTDASGEPYGPDEQSDLHDFASLYSDHPDFQKAWMP